MGNRAILVVGAALLAALSRGQGLQPEQFLTIGDKSYLVGPGQFVCESVNFDRISFAPDSRYLTFLRTDFEGLNVRKVYGLMTQMKPNQEPPKQLSSIYVWDDERSRLTKINLAVEPRSESNLLPAGAGRMVLWTRDGNGETKSFWCLLANGEARPAPELNGFSPALSAVPTMSLLTKGDGGSVVSPAGIKSLPFLGTESSYLALHDANNVIVESRGKPKERSSFRLVNINTGASVPFNIDTWEPGGGNTPPFQVTGTETAVGKLMADGDIKAEGAGAIKLGISDATVSPDGKKVAYTMGANLYVSDILAVDKKLMEQARLAALRTVALSSAKQAGLGLILYASDHDDNLPSIQGFRDSVMPYLKNDKILNGFVYTYNGTPNMANIKDPANTELGYTYGPGGRAVVYADGHAKWVPDA